MTDAATATSAGLGRPIVVVGAGGHAKVVIECLRFGGWDVVGCTDSDSTPRRCAGAPVIGTDQELPRLINDGVRHAFCAIGDNHVRADIANSLLRLGFELPVAFGPGAVVSSSARLGAGVAVMPAAVVNVEAFVGNFAIINTNASIDHDCRIGEAAHIAPGSALAGSVEVGARAFLGTGSVVIPGCKIGAETVVGAGSVVVGDLAPRVLAFGNPAKVQRLL